MDAEKPERRPNRADRRRAKKDIISMARETEIDATADALRRVDTLKSYCAAYKARLQRVTIGLNAIQVALLKNDIQNAIFFMRALFASDLAEARKVVADRDFGLSIAIRALQRHDKSRDIEEALSQVRQLCPEAFEKMEEPTAGAVVDAEVTEEVIEKAS